MKLAPLFIVLALVGASCQTSRVTGGTARHDTGGFVVDYYPPNGGRVVVKDDREQVATTQPSVQLSGGDVTKFNSTTAREGTIGGFTFDAKTLQKPNVIGAVLFFAALGFVGWYFLKSPLITILSGAGIVLAFMAPDLLVWGTIAVVGAVVFMFIRKQQQTDKTVTQIVAGNQNAVGALTDAAAGIVKEEWDKAQDADVKLKVAAVKAKVTTAKA